MRVVILVPPDVQWLELFGPMEVFLDAGRLSGRADLYDVEVMATKHGPLGRSCGLSITPARTIADSAGPIDTLLIAGGTEADINDEAAKWIAASVGHTRRYGACGTGAFLLAAAGLLDGRRATTHWEHAERFAALFPKVMVESGPVFVKDGSIYSAAGASAALDLALALIEEDVGRDLALAVTRRLVMYLKRTGDQSQISLHLATQLSTRPVMQYIQQWILGNLCEDLTVARLSREAGMSTRNFSRIFHRDTGATPAEFVEKARVDAARRLLQESDLPLKRIAARCGFPNPGRMRDAFYRRLGMTANGYRATARTTYARGKHADGHYALTLVSPATAHPPSPAGAKPLTYFT